MLQRLLPFGLAGLAGGVAFGWMLAGGTPVPPPVPAEAPARAAPDEIEIEIGTLPEDCATRQEVLQAERDRLASALQAAQLTRRVQEAQRVDREGEPVAFPDDLDPVEQPAGLEAALRGALDETRLASITELDCEEYPCVFSLQLHQTLLDNAVSDAPFKPLFEALDQRGFADLQLVGGHSTVREADGGYRQVSTFAIADPGRVDRNLAKRVRFRAENAFERAVDQLESEVTP